MGQKQSSAFITTRKGFCYLTVKRCGRNFHLMRIRNYTIEADDKRHLTRSHRDILFDWNQIAQQLALKREVCRCYRSRRRTQDSVRSPSGREPLYAFFDPATRTVYANDVPSSAAEAGALLDAVLRLDRSWE